MNRSRFSGSIILLFALSSVQFNSVRAGEPIEHDFIGKEQETDNERSDKPIPIREWNNNNTFTYLQKKFSKHEQNLKDCLRKSPLADAGCNIDH